MKIPPPEGYEWCAAWEADRDANRYPCCGFIDLKSVAPLIIVGYREDLNFIGFLRKKRPELPQEIIDAGWEYADSWGEAQKMGVIYQLDYKELRACLLIGERRIVSMPSEIEDAINKDVFVCWLKVKK